MENIKDKIDNAFIEMITVNEIENITVTQLCEYLKISRKTFYSYYKDKYEILESIFVRTIIAPMKYSVNHYVTPYIVTKEIYREMYVKKDFYIRSAKYRGQNSLVSIIEKHIKDFVMFGLETYNGTDTDKDYISSYYAAAQATLIFKWLNGGMEVTPERMAEYCDVLLSNSFFMTIKHKFVR